MFERFSDDARQAVVLSQDEARRLGHSAIGAEHLLLGLVRGDEPGVGSVLGRAGLDLERLRAEFAELVPADEGGPPDHVPFTPRAKKVLELGLREAGRLGSEVIVPGHLLLGMIREGQGRAVRVIADAVGDLELVRREVERSLRGRAARTMPLSLLRGGRAVAGERLERIEARLTAIETHLVRLAARLDPPNDRPES
ncbi:Clp protease N-terminal domain-containing protein [Actinomadura oligospora]|uniref:Clp protease N-terminal domain-containing protein n=1 Tax=Actinomadura oligospora TaxID=111804 RepID=UPI0004B67AF2|nr:Clp protease N-terminal domain-containing protein [Actinomadura oligospora]